MEAKSYQVELYEKAKEGNAIIKLNTGSGKTFIASMIIKDCLNYTSNKKIFFLVKNASLAHQHTNYLRDYLFLKNEVGCFHGNMNNSWVDFWTKDKWAVEIAKHKVIIMTAKVFLDILNHKKYSLDHICLLIFDEVHHLTKADDYTQISEHLTSDFRDVNVLGLTACLVKTVKKLKDIEFYIDEIEKRLNCKVITSLDSIANEFSTNVENIFLTYDDEESDDIDTLKQILQSSLEKIQALDVPQTAERISAVNSEGFISDDNFLIDILKYIKDISSIINTMGIIACNCIVEEFFKDKQKSMLIKDFPEDKMILAITEFLSCLSQLKDASHAILKRSKHLNCSHKIRQLMKFILEKNLEFSDQSRDMFILIFVKERIQALALSDLLNLLPKISDEFAFIKSEFITGHSISKYPKKLEMSGSDQSKIINRFRDRKFNVLVATSVVEEGLDIPHCNIVVKFEPPSEFCSYLQSKGRARAQYSQYVILVKSEQLALVQQRILTFDLINKTINECLKSRAIGNDILEDDALDDDEMDCETNSTDYKPYGRSGPRITLNSAASVLNRYIGKLRCNSLCDIKIRYEIEQDQNDLFQTTLLLPMPSPYLDKIQGGYHMNKRMATRFANLKACKILHEMDELDDHLLPYNRYEIDEEIIAPKEREMISKYEKYVANKLSSDFHNLSEQTSTLYVYSLRYKPQVFFKLGFDDFSAFDMSSTIGFLLPEPIHDINTGIVAKFPIYLVGGNCDVQINFEETLPVNVQQVQKFLQLHEALFHIYAQRIRKFCPNIKFSPNKSKCPLIITILKDFKVDYVTMDRVLTNEHVVNLTVIPQSNWIGSVIRPTYLKKEFGAYVVTKINWNMNALSLIMGKEISYKEYYEKTYQLTFTDDEALHPLISVKRLTTIQSCINKEKRSIADSKRLQTINHRETYFIPLTTECISLSSSLWTHLCIFPTIHLRLNQIFTLQDFTRTLDFMDLSDLSQPIEVNFDECYQIENILSTNTYHDVNSFINNVFPCFVSKTCNDRLDLEQYEILGDSFLKYITTKYLYHFSKPTDNEGKLTQLRSNLISNRTLYKLAQTKELWKYLSFSVFDPKLNYLPPNFVVSTDIVTPCRRNDREYVFYKSKCLADCVEAFVGSVYTNYAEEYVVKLLLWINMKLFPDDYDGEKFEINAHPPTFFCGSCISDPPIPECIGDLERILKYTFKYKAYAVQAITHPTSIENRMFSCYQRLEFVGDAVLDFLVTSYIMVKNSTMKPGKITNLRSALVSNNTFAYLSAKWELYKIFNYFDSKMFYAMPEVVEGLLANQLDSETVFLKKSEQFKVIVKVLGDIFESIAGAIFVDSDYNLDIVWEVYQRLMEEPLKKFSNCIPKNKITILHERFPQLKCQYEVEEGTNLIILKASFPDGRLLEIKESNKTLCKLSLVQELNI